MIREDLRALLSAQRIEPAIGQQSFQYTFLHST